VRTLQDGDGEGGGGGDQRGYAGDEPEFPQQFHEQYDGGGGGAGGGDAAVVTCQGPVVLGVSDMWGSGVGRWWSV
jgi:hypothetical protein